MNEVTTIGIDLAKSVFQVLGYARGNGVPQDYVQAHKWFNLAAIQGHKKLLIDRSRPYGRC